MSTRTPMIALAAIALAATALTPVSASAFGHSGGGGFGGGFGGGNFGHAMSFGRHADAGGGFARTPFRPMASFHSMHVAPRTRVAATEPFAPRHPQEPAQVRRPYWYVPWQHPFNGATDNQSAPGVPSATAVGRGVANNRPGQTGGVTDVARPSGQQGGVPQSNTNPDTNPGPCPYGNDPSWISNPGAQNCQLPGWAYSASFGRGGPGGTDKPTALGAAEAAGRVAAINQAGQTSTAPNVVVSGSVFGQGGQQDGPPATVPGLGSEYGGASQLNNPGSQNGQQQQAVGAIPNGAIPGVDSSLGGAGTLNNNNTASDSSSQNDIDAAAAAVDKMVGQGNGLIDQGMQGGASSLNIPTQASPEQESSLRDSGNQNQNPIGIKASSDSNTNVGTTPGDKESNYGTFAGSYPANTSQNGERGAATAGDAPPPKPPGGKGGKNGDPDPDELEPPAARPGGSRPTAPPSRQTVAAAPATTPRPMAARPGDWPPAPP